MLTFFVSQTSGFFLILLILILMFRILFLDAMMDVVLVHVFVRDTMISNLIELDITRPAGVEDVWLTVTCYNKRLNVPSSQSFSHIFKIYRRGFYVNKYEKEF